MCVQYRGGVQYHGGVQYRGNIMMHVGGYLEYHRGYHDKFGGYLEYRGGVQYRGEKIFCYLSTLTVLNTPHGTHDIPPVLSIPHGTQDNPHSTQDIPTFIMVHLPQYSRFPPPPPPR